MESSVHRESCPGAMANQRTRAVPTQNRPSDMPVASGRDHIQQLNDAALFTRDLLRLLGIQRVVDVDDSWHDGLEPDRELVLAAAGAGMLQLDDLSANESLRPLTANGDGEPLDLEDVLDNLRRDWD